MGTFSQNYLIFVEIKKKQEIKKSGCMQVTDFLIYYCSILELLVSAYNTDNPIRDISVFPMQVLLYSCSHQ
jgi:hypothetical protein